MVPACMGPGERQTAGQIVKGLRGQVEQRETWTRHRILFRKDFIFGCDASVQWVSNTHRAIYSVFSGRFKFWYSTFLFSIVGAILYHAHAWCFISCTHRDFSKCSFLFIISTQGFYTVVEAKLIRLKTAATRQIGNINKIDPPIFCCCKSDWNFHNKKKFNSEEITSSLWVSFSDMGYAHSPALFLLEQYICCDVAFELLEM